MHSRPSDLTPPEPTSWITPVQGPITIEICNVNQRPVRMYAGMPIGQLVFYTTERADHPYNLKKDAKYMDQRQATLSRYHENPREI